MIKLIKFLIVINISLNEIKSCATKKMEPVRYLVFDIRNAFITKHELNIYTVTVITYRDPRTISQLKISGSGTNYRNYFKKIN